MFTVAKEITQIINRYNLCYLYLEEFIDNVALVEYDDSIRWNPTRSRLNYTEFSNFSSYTIMDGKTFYKPIGDFPITESMKISNFINRTQTSASLPKRYIWTMIECDYS